MALGLQKTKRRIASVKTTKKLTKAMEMIATTKLHTWRDRMLQTRAYTDALLDILHRHLSGQDAATHPLFNVNAKADKDLYIVITSYLGLCGSYNHNVFNLVNKTVRDKDDLMIIGTKGVRHYQNEGRVIDSRYEQLAIHLDLGEIKLAGKAILQSFIEGRYQHIYLLYTHFVNAMSALPQVMTLLPLPKAETPQEEAGFGPLIEPDLETLISDLAPFYVNNMLFSTMIESQISEQSLRRFAMEQASDNADELIDQLFLEYNKERQSAITQEITEIIGASGNS